MAKNDNMKDLAKALMEQAKLQKALNTSASEYLKILEQIAIKDEAINNAKKVELELEEELTNLQKKQLDIQNGIINATDDEIDELKKIIAAKKISVKLTKAGIKALEDENNELKEAVKNTNKLNLAFKSTNKAIGKMPGLIKKGFGKLKSSGIFEMDKSIRMAGLEMGKIASATSSFGKDIAEASRTTWSMGVHTKDLAKMQASFSTELGRAVLLSKEGYEAMGELANGTMLGSEGAASLVAEMDRFNISATATRDIIQDTVNSSEKMGLNSTKVIKNLQNNLKLANKYSFKNGVKGITKMAQQATKFNMSMETTAQFADKLFDIEGAVEMSAKLNTMGGEWAKLGDPMKLMNQARNDMEGLQTSIIDSTAGMADFNSTTGEFSFSGLELHRMRELEKITGISAEQMAEMAKSKAKFAKINAQLGMKFGSSEEEQMMKEMITNKAVFKNGEFKIKISGSEELIPINKLSTLQKDNLKAESKSLKARAEASQTFDDELTNGIEGLKTLLLPLLQGFNDKLPKLTDSFNKLLNSDMGKNIKKGAEQIGKVIGFFLEKITEFPNLFLGAVAGMGILKGVTWLMNGRMLAKGFMSSLGGFGGGGGKGGGPKNMSSGRRQVMKRNSGFSGSHSASGVSKASKAGGKAGGKGISKMFGKGAGKGLSKILGKGLGKSLLKKIPGLGLLAGLAFGAGRAMDGDWLGALGEVGSGAASLIPGIGTAASIGIDGMLAARDMSMAPAVGDGIIADGKVTPIDSKDKVFEISKPGGAYDKAANSPSSSNNSTKNVNLKITFDDIIVKSNGNQANIDLTNDSAFMSMLATKIKESLTITANGGVLSPNPS